MDRELRTAGMATGCRENKLRSKQYEFCRERENEPENPMPQIPTN